MLRLDRDRFPDWDSGFGRLIDWRPSRVANTGGLRRCHLALARSVLDLLIFCHFFFRLRRWLWFRGWLERIVRVFVRQ